jgi:hypothetical protein
MDDESKDAHFYADLKALAKSAFPKRCRNCGRVYETAQQFIDESRAVRPNATGLKQGYGDDDMALVELYRNCTCGSTLMDLFSNRRDTSLTGEQRRQLFDTSISYLVNRGLSVPQARQCLLRLLRGEASDADMAMLLGDKLT